MDERSLTYRGLAEATRKLDGKGITHAHINMLANGHDKPSMRAMELIAAACEVDPDYFAEYRLAAAMRELDPAEVGLEQALENLGIEVQGQALNTAFKRFKEIADRKKTVSAMDLEALVTDELREEIAGYQLEWFDVEASTRRPPHATVGITTPDGEEVTGSFTGDGPVDAIFRAINAATGVDARLREFRVDAVTGGQDALGDTSVVVEVGGVIGAGQGVSTDILEAGARAYVRALSNAIRRRAARADEAAASAESVPTP